MRQKNILVSGWPGVGKTTLVQAVVSVFEGDFSGFLTREIRSDGERRGFEVESLDGRRATLAHVDVAGEVRVGKYGVDVRGFEEVALPALMEGLRRGRGVVIDEIGRMELASQQFRRMLVEVLDSRCVVLATIQIHPDSFSEHIKTRPDSILLTLTRANRDRLNGELMVLVRNLLRSPA